MVELLLGSAFRFGWKGAMRHPVKHFDSFLIPTTHRSPSTHKCTATGC